MRFFTKGKGFRHPGRSKENKSFKLAYSGGQPDNTDLPLLWQRDKINPWQGCHINPNVDATGPWRSV